MNADLSAIQVEVGRARAYVLAHGGVREEARVEGIMSRKSPDRAVLRDLEALQNADGGFPLHQWPGNPSGIDTTCFVLAQLKDMPPLAGSPMASRALAFLRRAQAPDGSWAEAAGVQELAPEWASTGNPGAQGCLTANAAYTLLSLEPEHMDPIARAAAWLRGQLLGDAGESARAAAFNQTLALATALFYRVEGPGSAAAYTCYESLAQRTLGASDLTRWLSLCLESGLGGRLLVPVAQSLVQLAAFQQTDGSWPSEPLQETEATIQALRVLRGYGCI